MFTGCVEWEEAKVVAEDYNRNTGAYTLTLDYHDREYITDVRRKKHDALLSTGEPVGHVSVEGLEKRIEPGSTIEFTAIPWFNGDGLREDGFGKLYTHRIRLKREENKR